MERYIAQSEVGGFLDTSRHARFGGGNPAGVNCTPVWSHDFFNPETLTDDQVRVFLFSKPSKDSEINIGDQLLFDYPWL